MTNSIRTRIARPVLAGLVALILLGSITPILQAGSAEAHSGTGIPYHLAGSPGCGGFGPGVFDTATPVMNSVSGNTEAVFWQPVLYKYTTRGWVAVQQHNWAWAMAYRYGIVRQPGGEWFEISPAMVVTTTPVPHWRTFSGLTAGWYRVVNNYIWANGAHYEEFGAMCQFR